MPWIGLYIATASLVCTVAMAADASIGFRSKKLWFPCKYFTLNAFSLTLLAATMKLPLDLTSFTIQDDDKLARISSLVFMSTAIANFMTSLHLDLAYSEMHRKISDKQLVTAGELKTVVTRYWVMAETGGSQFVIARSVTCVASGVMCLLMGLTLLHVEKRKFSYEGKVSSNYKWSIKLILLVQTIGVIVGGIAPVMRWFIVARFKSSKIGHMSFKDELKVEAYWNERLVYWRDRSVPLQVGFQILRKLVYDAKRLLLNICIGVQSAIVRASKLALLISATFLKVPLFCFHRIKKSGVESSRGMEQNYSRYVLLLEGESQLPQKTLRNICNEVDKLIQIGKKKQPNNLIDFLKVSANFNGVGKFDPREVLSLHFDHETPNCWSLPVMTLTAIAISLNIVDANKRVNRFLSAVGEGLYFAKLIERTLDKNGDLTSILHAADVVWVGVEFSRKWLDNDLQDASVGGGSPNETLQKLSRIADDIFTTEMNDPLMQNPLYWPLKVIAARSMYRVTQTILLSHTNNDSQTDEELFERLSVMISDILAACLTNLVPDVILKSHSNVIEEREESVRGTAVLLGQSEGILKIPPPRDLPSLDPIKAAYIKECRATMALNRPGIDVFIE
ncbi:hypothetical protein ABFS82_09G049400 [Erythranthe guttata]|uniref:DUF4220 domain-containing protein n=1 Tax=Erythranthe guttata TaxID=4155 RepID=A0A022PT95_ERYGU|nr:hypothetical protein MIMGU_mgv1a021811mg [Erythranthe guttata]